MIIDSNNNMFVFKRESKKDVSIKIVQSVVAKKNTEPLEVAIAEVVRLREVLGSILYSIEECENPFFPSNTKRITERYISKLRIIKNLIRAQIQ